MKKKFLVIRFSSFGDIVQCMAALEIIKQKWPDSEIHWVTKTDFEELLSINPHIDKIWALNKKEGIKGLIQMSKALKQEKYDFVYDAHCNIRSRIVRLILNSFFSSTKVAVRTKDRLKRLLLFKLGINLLPWPFKGMISYQKPLKKWGVEICSNFSIDARFSNELQSKVKALVYSENFNNQKMICLVPATAWDMKCWPVEYWQELVKRLPEKKFIVLGGPQDQVCEEIKSAAPARVINMAGKLSLLESSYALSLSELVISADTGLLHVADILGMKTLALIGPSAFGFPTNHSVKTIDVSLDCRPCSKDGRGKCKQKIYKRCLMEIVPSRVVEEVKNLL